MNALKQEAVDQTTAGSIFTDAALGDRVATYDDLRDVRFGGSYTTADVAMGDYDYREEAGDRDENYSELKALEDVARINVSNTKSYGNKRATRNMTDGQRVHSMWYRFAETMSRLDNSTAKLLNDLAYDGWKAARETAEKLDAEKTGRKSSESAFSDRFLVVAQTEGEARIVRAWMNLAMQYVGDGRTLGDTRPTRFSVNHLPPEDKIADLLHATRPALDLAAKNAAIGVIAAQGAEAAAIDFMKSVKAPVMPGAGRGLWDAVSKDPDLKKRVRMLDQDSKKKSSDAVINRKVAFEAERLVAFLSGNPEQDEKLMEAIARAFQRGTLSAAFSVSGEMLSQFAIGEQADAMHPSIAVENHNREIQRYMEMKAASPEGRLLLSLLPKMNRATIDSLANSDRTVGEILTLARTDEGRGTLYTQFGVASATLEAMANGNAIAAAGAAHGKIIADCRDHKVTLVAPENFPGGLKNDPDAPAVLYVQAKDPAALGGVPAHLLMAGDDKAPAWMERRSSHLAGLVHAGGNFLAEIEGRGQSGLNIDTPSILWLSTGHAHADVQATGLEWSRDEMPTARGANGNTWEIVRQEKTGTKDLWLLFETTADGHTAERNKLWVPRNPEDVTKARQKLKAAASAEESKRAREPVMAARKAIVEAGGFVVSAQPPVEKNHAYRWATNTVSGFTTYSTPETRRQIARLAVKSADALCVTYARASETSSALIGTAVIEGKGMIAVSAPQAREYSPAVDRQVKLYSRPGREIADAFPDMPAEAKLKLSKAYAEKHICGHTGEDPQGAAQRITARLTGAAPKLSRATPAREAKREIEPELA